MKCSIKYLASVLLLFMLHPPGAKANDLSPSYVTAGIAFPTPTNYEDFDFGLGGYANIGWLARVGLFEVEYFDTTSPATSNDAHGIELDRIPGSGPTDYYSRALTTSWGRLYNLEFLLVKVKVGLSYRDYQIKRPGFKDKEKAFGLSYGASFGVAVFQGGFITLEYNAIDHLIATGNLGLLIIF